MILPHPLQPSPQPFMVSISQPLFPSPTLIAPMLIAPMLIAPMLTAPMLIVHSDAGSLFNGMSHNTCSLLLLPPLLQPVPCPRNYQANRDSLLAANARCRR